MKLHESSLREILDITKCFLQKKDERFTFKVTHQPERQRYVVQVLMGRKEFEELYTLSYDRLMYKPYCKFLYQRFGSEIIKNLRLNKLMWR